jgi:hypothetical protein
MTIQETGTKPEIPAVSNQTAPEKPNRFFRFVPEELNFIRRGLAAWQLHALLLLTLLLWALAYQTGQDFRFKLGLANPADTLYIQSFNREEANSDLSFRWTSAESRVRFPGIGRLPYSRLEMTMQIGGRPPNLGNAKVQIWHEQQLLGEVEVTPGEKVYSFEYRPQNFQQSDLDGNLIFIVRTLNPFDDSQHNLPLGVVVSEGRLVGGSEYGRPVIPALPHLTLLLSSLLILYLAMFRAGWQATGAVIGAGLFGLGAALAIAFARMHLTPTVEPLFLIIILAYPLMVIGLRFTGRWVALPVESARWLGLIFLSAFVVKAAGMAHPAYDFIDHWFRIHQILRFWGNPAEFWAQYFNVSAGASVTGVDSGSAVLGQWGVKFSLPYSPLFYLFAAPLALIWNTRDPNLLAAINDLAAWLEVSQVFLIYIIARKAYNGRWANRAGVIAAAFLGFYPLSYLLFSDGGYNSIFAHWLTLLFVALLLSAVRQEAKWAAWRWTSLILTLTATLLSHTSTLLLVSLLVMVTCGLWFSLKEWRWAAKRLLWVSLAAFGLNLILYYGYYLINFITQSLPALISKLGSEGSLGQDNEKLGTRLLSGFFPQLWEHFRFFPFLLTLAAIVVLKIIKLPEEDNQPRSKAMGLFWLAWLSVFLLFALADLRINLLQKHMLFVAPLLCLGNGFTLSLLWEKAASYKKPLTTGLVAGLIGLLVAYTVWQGLILWYGRIYFYTLPPGSG